ncbi:hypothetical protein [Kitasatospora sp. McL0602]|uniref:hypothetical protein n=1 Tax=Kitasatospora sp. McL0602 TaxID=3439530 RepID=UPI003F89709D
MTDHVDHEDQTDVTHTDVTHADVTPADVTPADVTQPDVLDAGEPRRPRSDGLLRWGAAALVLLLTGAAAAVAVTLPERADLPGLGTPNDGRYSFAPLVLPPLPSGKPRPDSVADRAHHFADLRGLLLPAPKGATSVVPAVSPAVSPTATATATATPTGSGTPTATPSATPPGTGTVWARCTDYAARDLHPATYTRLLTENACRSAARRSWTGPDGTRTELWLLGFGSGPEADTFYREMVSDDPLELPHLASTDLDLGPGVHLPEAKFRATEKTAGAKKNAVGRVAYLSQGDVLAAVVMTNPKGVPVQAFAQVTLLQGDLLR